MSESSGVFTFPSTGIYYISYVASLYLIQSNNYAGVFLDGTTNNSSYVEISKAYGGSGDSARYTMVNGDIIFDVTDTSTHKVKLRAYSENNINIQGDTAATRTGITFIRLGDT